MGGNSPAGSAPNGGSQPAETNGGRSLSRDEEGNGNAGNGNAGNGDSGNASGGNGNSGNNSSGANSDEPVPTQTIDGRSVDLTKPPKVQLASVLDLVGARVQVQFEGEAEPAVVESPFAADTGSMSTYLIELMDRVTLSEEPVLIGRVNVNQAPRAVLLAVPGMPAEAVETIMAQRIVSSDSQDPSYKHATWLLAQGIVTLDQMKAIEPHVTAGGRVFRAQVVGFFDAGNASARAEIVVDATASPPSLVSWKDLSHLGRGFSLELLGGGATGP